MAVTHTYNDAGWLTQTEQGMRLNDAVERLGLPAHRPHHADGDALTTAQLFIALATRLDAVAPQTVGSLARLSAG